MHFKNHEQEQNEFDITTDFLDPELMREKLKKVIDRAAHLTREQEIFLLELDKFRNYLKRMEGSLLNFNFIKIKGSNNK